MNEIPTSWVHVGRTANTMYFTDKTGFLIAWPDEKSTDNEATAIENRDFQASYFRKHGAPGGIVIFFDRMVNQNRGARKVYAEGTNPKILAAVALVGGSMLARAMGSFFMGLSKPPVPIKMFATIGPAQAWLATKMPSGA